MEDNKKSKLKKIVMPLMLLVCIAIIIFAVYKIFNNNGDLPVLESLSVEELENMENVDFYFEEENSTHILIAGNFADAKITNEEEALNLLNTVKDILKIDSIDNEFKVLSNNKFMDDNNFRIQQYYNGVVVDGMQLIVTSDAEGNIKSLSGDYLKIEDLDTEPKITSSEVEKILEKNYGTENEIEEVELKITKIDDKPVLIWEVKATGTFTNLEDYSYIFYIDANSGEILDKKSIIINVDKANCSATVDGTTINFEATRDDDGTFLLTDLDRHILLGTYKTATSANPIESTNPNEWTDEIAIKAYTGVQKIYDYYNIKFGYNLTSEKPISVAINSKGDYKNNAAYVHNSSTGTILILLGEGDGENFNNFVEGLDVITHEITHAYVAQTVGNSFKMGEINEGYADVIGNIIENYFDENEEAKPYNKHENLSFSNDSNWLIGEDVVIETGEMGTKGAIRSLRNPARFNQPNTLYSGYYKSGSGVDEHENCTVIGNTAYRMWKDGFTTDEIAYIYINSCQRLTPWANYSNIGNMFLTICKEITPGKLETLREILKEQGILEGWEAEKTANKVYESGYFCEYEGEVYYWKLSDTSREKTALNNGIDIKGAQNQLVKIDKNGNEKVIYTGVGSREICIVNDRIFLSTTADDYENERKICSINLDGTDKQEHDSGKMKYIVSDYIIYQSPIGSICALNTKDYQITTIVEEKSGEVIELLTYIKDTIYYSIYNYEDHTMGISTITGVTSDRTTKITISNEFGYGFEEAGLLEVAYMWKDGDIINMYIDFRDGSANLINGIVKVTMDENLNNAQVLEADRDDLTTVMDTATNGIFVGTDEENGSYETYLMQVDNETGEIEKILKRDSIYEKYNLTKDTEHTLSLYNATKIDNEIYMIWDYRVHSPENDIGWRYAYTREKTIYLKYNTETKEITTIYEF